MLHDKRHIMARLVPGETPLVARRQVVFGRYDFKQHHTSRKFGMADSVASILDRLHREEEGQGMVEYVLIIALVALAATAGTSSLATAINSAFKKVGSLLNSYV
jgi:pilus assembly protein Flp/PilA